MAFDWNDRNIGHLREMWGKGVTASQIAAAIGNPSRDSVIAKAHRLGLAERPNPTMPSSKASTEAREPYKRRDADGKLKVSDRPKGAQGRTVNNPGGIRNAMLSRIGMKGAATVSLQQRNRIVFGSEAKITPSPKDETGAECRMPPIDSGTTKQPSDGKPVRQEDIRTNQCRYIVGNERGGKDALMCGQVVERDSLCVEHRARCWQRPPALKPREAA